jgi:hypothetical protein
MLLDVNSIFSDGQDITASTVSENTVAVPEYLGRGRQGFVVLYAKEDFDNLTSLTVELQQYVGSAWVGIRSMSLTLAQLNSGQVFAFELPRGNTGAELRLGYTVVGSNPAAGALFAGITPTLDEKYVAAQMIDGSAINTYLR